MGKWVCQSPQHESVTCSYWWAGTAPPKKKAFPENNTPLLRISFLYSSVKNSRYRIGNTSPKVTKGISNFIGPPVNHKPQGLNEKRDRITKNAETSKQNSSKQSERVQHSHTTLTKLLNKIVQSRLR